MQEVYDRAAKDVTPKSALSQDEKRYLAEITVLKQRIQENPYVAPHLFFDGTFRSDSVGRIILDTITGKSYEAEGIGIHSLPCDLLLSHIHREGVFSDREFCELDKHKDSLLSGFYMIHQDDYELFRGIKSRIVYVQEIPSREMAENDLSLFQANFFNPREYYVFALARECEINGCCWPNSENPSSWGDLTEDQRKIADNLLTKIKEEARKNLTLINRLAKLSREERKYIFLGCTGAVLEPQ